MAVVYLAKDQRHRRDVAVKVFHIDGGPLDGAPRFLHEIEVAARLAHPNILPLHDSGEDQDLIYYVMPYVPGENLRQRLEREGALPVADALAIATQVAGALSYAHSHGVIHRDIKPENILFIAGQAVVADFGIARAISAGGWDEVQLGRGLLGTPAYMSPEQAQSSSRVDGRSDLYSLGCVLYEMLTGEPPFRGTTPEEVVVQHIEVEPQPVHARRPALTRDLELLVGKALAKHPADRYQTAQQFIDAITSLGSGRDWSGSFTAKTPRGLPDSGWLRRIGLPGLAAMAVAYAVYVQLPTDGVWSWSPANPSLHLVAPFVHRDGAAPELLSGDQCGRLIQEALARWEDVDLVDARWTSDQLERLGHQPTIDELVTIARRAHASRLVSGEVYRFRDSIRVHGVLYDVRRRGRVIRERTVTLGADLGDADRRFSELADSLLLPRATIAAAAGGAMGTNQIAAWQAYDSGHVALARWDLPEASRHFTAAITLDPGYGLAHMWLAQTENWDGQPPDVWRDHALAGLGATPPLGPHDREWALALAALGESHFPEACDRYESMIRRDSLDFRGWYGRAECRARDRLVMKDAKSPSGWRFRSSYQGAINDYRRALTLVPSSHRAFKGAAFDRLSEMFFAEPNLTRRGVRADAAAADFLAFPALDGDTLAFVPFTKEALGDTREAGRAAPHGPALEANRRALRGLVAEWVRSFPKSALALEAEGQALERSGDVTTNRTLPDSALLRYQQALALSSGSDDRVRLAASELRVLIKQGQFSNAARFADSLLDATPDPAGESAAMLSGAAALLGRADLAASLARRAAPDQVVWAADGRVLAVPLALRETALAFEALSAIGGPADSLLRLRDRAGRQLRAFIGESARAWVEGALLDRSFAMQYPGPGSVPLTQRARQADYLLDMQRALRRGDTLTVRRNLRELAQVRRDIRPVDVSTEAVYQESLAALALGDTAAVIARLDAVLGALPSAGVDLTGRVASAASLVRVMILRAELAAHSGDRATAKKWATPVTQLWARADAGLRPAVDAMRRLAALPS